MEVTDAEVRGESRRDGTPLVWFSQEEQLLRRLEEVERFGAKIAGELLKSVPCEGAVSRELLELELGELKRDRDILEDKLTLLLSSATLPAPSNGPSYEAFAGITGRDVSLRPSPPAGAERKDGDTPPPRPTTIDDLGMSVTKTTTNLSCGRKSFPADSEAPVDKFGVSKRDITQQKPSEVPRALDSNTGTNSASTRSTSTAHGNGVITAESGDERDLDDKLVCDLSSPALVRSSSSTRHDRVAIAAGSGGGFDSDASVNTSLSSTGLGQSGSSSMHGRAAGTAGGDGGHDLDEKVIENLSSPALVRSGSSISRGRGAMTRGSGSGRDLDAMTNHNPILSGGNGFNQVGTERLTDDSYARADECYARTDDGYARTDDIYARPDDGHARNDDIYAGADGGYAQRARTVAVVDRNRRLYNAAPAPPSRFGTDPIRSGYNGYNGCNGGVVAGGGGGVGGGRGVSGVSRSVEMVESGGSGRGDGGGRGFSVSKWQCRKSSDASAWQTAHSDTSRQQQRWTSAPFAPDTGTTTRSGTITDIVGHGNPGRCGATINSMNIDTTPTRMTLKRTASLGEQASHESSHFSSGVRTVTGSSEGGATRTSHPSSCQGERRAGPGGQRIKRGPFRAPVAPFSSSDMRDGIFNEDRYLASLVSYPLPRPSQDSHNGWYHQQRDYRDTQSVRRDMSFEEPFFSKRKSFRLRVSEEKQEGQQEPCSKRSWPDAPARWHGVDNGNGARGSTHEFAIHTVPVALAADAPCERTRGIGEDGRLYYSYSRQGQPLEGRHPQDVMPLDSFSSNTAQMLSERGGGRYELGPTVTPPPFR